MKLVVLSNEFRKNMENREEAISKLFSKVRDHGEKGTVVSKLIEDKGKDLVNVDDDIKRMKFFLDIVRYDDDRLFKLLLKIIKVEGSEGFLKDLIRNESYNKECLSS